VISSSIRAAQDGSRWVVVVVEDDGVGMDADTLAHGRVEVDSAPGRGTRVAVWLPAT
jgi:signal transduction histidine kinase